MSRKPPEQTSPYERRLARGGYVSPLKDPEGEERNFKLTTVEGTISAKVDDVKLFDQVTATDARARRDSFQDWTEKHLQDLARSVFMTPEQLSGERRTESLAAKHERELRPHVERYFLKGEHQLEWTDIIGNETARRALLAAIEHPVRHKALYAHYRKRAAKGVLLFGPPGCGKTMFGKAAASALRRMHGGRGTAIMIKINGSEIQQPWVGETEKIIRAIFAYARAFKALHGFPLVIFIDEADAILPNRDFSVTGRRAMQWEESNVATFLTEMDGIEDSGAFVILATNRPHAIDAALTRDGRCDRRIKIERPGQEAVAEILLRGFGAAPVIGNDAAAMTARTIDALYDPDRKLKRLRTNRGLDFLRLSDVISGAMAVGLVERAKEIAFERDLENGGAPSAITEADVLAAISAMQLENVDVDHFYALVEYCERAACELQAVEPLSRGGGARLSVASGGE